MPMTGACPGPMPMAGGGIGYGLDPADVALPTAFLRRNAARQTTAPGCGRGPRALKLRAANSARNVSLFSAHAVAVPRAPRRRTTAAAECCRFRHTMARRRCRASIRCVPDVEFLTRYNPSNRSSGNLSVPKPNRLGQPRLKSLRPGPVGNSTDYRPLVALRF